MERSTRPGDPLSIKLEVDPLLAWHRACLRADRNRLLRDLRLGLVTVEDVAHVYGCWPSDVRTELGL